MITQTIDQRKQKILQAVIHRYISSGKPVGSKVLALSYDFDLSAASIRNVMAELERGGFLTHPHTSAGRVPTDYGYRFYVDKLVNIQELAHQEAQRIQREYETHKKEIEQVMRQTSRMLSLLSNYTGFVLPPLMQGTAFKHIELIFLERKKFIAVLITDTDLVKHKIIDINEDITPELLRRASRLYNEILRGLTLSQIKQAISREFVPAKVPDSKLLNFIQKMSRRIFTFEADEDIYVEGTTNIFTHAHADFDDYQRMKSVFEVIEQRQFLSQLLSRRLNDKGTKVLIGNENPYKEMQDCSLITSTYEAGNQAVGVLGIIGPKRMEYSKMISLVDFISKLLNEVLRKK
ncbi:MAG: heat-inducible transcriptional repressor HrcA [bacterium]